MYGISDLLGIAEEYYIVTFLIIAGVGFLQGAIISRGIRRRFPSVRAHTRIVSIILLIVFGANAIFSSVQFATLEAIELEVVTNSNDIIGAIISNISQVFGIDGQFWSMLAILVTMILMLVFKLAELSKPARYFMLVIGIATLLAVLVGRFGAYDPTIFHVVMYSLYHVGLVAGVYLVMRKKAKQDIEF